jgi:hypothetical protein
MQEAFVAGGYGHDRGRRIGTSTRAFLAEERDHTLLKQRSRLVVVLAK